MLDLRLVISGSIPSSTGNSACRSTLISNYNFLAHAGAVPILKVTAASFPSTQPTLPSILHSRPRCWQRSQRNGPHCRRHKLWCISVRCLTVLKSVLFCLPLVNFHQKLYCVDRVKSTFGVQIGANKCPANISRSSACATSRQRWYP